MSNKAVFILFSFIHYYSDVASDLAWAGNVTQGRIKQMPFFRWWKERQVCVTYLLSAHIGPGWAGRVVYYFNALHGRLRIFIEYHQFLLMLNLCIIVKVMNFKELINIFKILTLETKTSLRAGALNPQLYQSVPCSSQYHQDRLM